MASDEDIKKQVEKLLRLNRSDQRNNGGNGQSGNGNCCNRFTNKQWICIICVILTIVVGLPLTISVIASYINRQTDPLKHEEKAPSQISHLSCYHCSWSVNVENKSPLPKESSCPSNPKNTIQCEPGDYCGLRYLEYFETGSKLLERTCLKRPEILKPGEHICIDQTRDNVNHTICRCNKELCIMQKFDPI